MEIFKVGDEISISGYNSITLTADMKTNIENFAKVNGIEQTEAERILNSHPAIQNFIANLSSQDEEVDYEITSDFKNETIENKTSTVNSTLFGNSGNNQKITPTTNTYSKEDLDKVQSEIKDLEAQIKSKLESINNTENDFEQYTIEQEANSLLNNLKTKTIEYNRMLAVNSGRTLSDTETNLLSYIVDSSYRQESATIKIAYLEDKMALISSKREHATDDATRDMLTQQYNACKQMKTLFEFDSSRLDSSNTTAKNLLSIAQKYPNNQEIQNIISQQAELNNTLWGITVQKQTAMQNEDEYAQYTLETQENNIHNQLKTLEVSLQQEIAKEEGRTLSDTEISLIEANCDFKFRQARLDEKLKYLDFKETDIKSQKRTAEQNNDTYAQTILEQQENAVNALRAIFNLDSVNINKSANAVEKALEILRKYSNNTAIHNIISEQIKLYEDLADISSRKSVAFQNEDDKTQATLEEQENSLNVQIKALEVNLQKEIAKAEGKTLSTSDITKIEEEFDLNTFKDKISEIKAYLQYKLISISQQMSTATQNEDSYAISVLEQQQANINNMYIQIEELENVTNATAGYALLNSIIQSNKYKALTNSTPIAEATTKTGEATSKNDIVPEVQASTASAVTPPAEVQKAEAVKSTAKTGASETPEFHYASASTTNDNLIQDLLGMFGFPTNTVIDENDYIRDGNKIIGFKLNGKEYRVIFYTNADNKPERLGAVKEIQIKDENNKITRMAYPADPLEQYRINVEVAKDELLADIILYLRGTKSNFSSYDEQRISAMLDECVEDYKNQIGVGTFYRYFLTKLSDKLGYNISGIRENIENTTPIGLGILEKFNNLLSVVDSGKALEEEEKKWTTEYVIKDGINFKIRYLKTEGSNPCSINVTDGKIVISGKNCTVDVLGLGSYSNEVQIDGENIIVNCNATTLGGITNNAKNSTINGSYGNDTITNSAQAVGTTINAGAGDDTIINRANDAKLNGQSGNDTFINYANATINGGDGDDVVNRADNVRTNIIESAGNDQEYTFHVDGGDPGGGGDNPEDPDYPYTHDYSICGVTFTVYSKTNDFTGVTYTSYKHLVTINASDVKIKIKSKTHDDTRIRLEGDTLNFTSNVTLASVFNYADHSTINGTSGDDALFNYADDVTVKGLDGKDRLINEGSNVNLDGGDKEDHIYNRQNDGTVRITDDGNDKVYNENNATSRITISQGSMSDKDYNLTVAIAYIENAINNSNVTIDSTVSQSVYNNIQSLLSTLTTTSGGKTVYSETALKLINYARNKSTDNAGKTNIELLKIALTEADTTVDGNITSAELTAFITKVENSGSSSGGETPSSSSNVLGYNLPSLKDATIESLSTSLKSAVGLTDAQMTAFITAQGSNENALKVLKQIQTIINMCSSSSISLKDNIKSMMTDDTFDFNNEILADAQMVVEALESGDYNSAIKDKMIFNGSSLTDSQILAQTAAGDVVQKADGNLYVNNGSSLTKLNISADTYLSLFPPIARYFVEQNDYEDCFFLATTLIEGMENGTSRAVLLQMFSEDASGNITVKFPNIDYPVTFYGGQLKVTDGQWSQIQSGSSVTYNWNDYNRETTPVTTQAKGLSMLEQAYALAKFAELSNANVSYESITQYYSEPLAAAVDDAKITDASNLDMDKALLFYYKGGYDNNVYEDLYGSTSNEHRSFTDCTTTAEKEAILLAAYNNSQNSRGVMTTRILGSVSSEDALKYNLGSGHQYAIERIDTVNKVVYVKNPWEGYMVSAIPYDVFFEYFSDIFYRTM